VSALDGLCPVEECLKPAGLGQCRSDVARWCAACNMWSTQSGSAGTSLLAAQGRDETGTVDSRRATWLK